MCAEFFFVSSSFSKINIFLEYSCFKQNSKSFTIVNLKNCRESSDIIGHIKEFVFILSAMEKPLRDFKQERYDQI